MSNPTKNLAIKSSRKSFLQNATTVHFQTLNDEAFIKLRALFSHKFNANGFNTIKRLEKLFREQTAMTDGLMTIRELKQTVRNIEWEEGISNDTEGLLPEVGNVHLKLTDKDFETIFMSLDDVHMGKLHFEQFLQAIRGPLSPDRMLLVDLAFEKLDIDAKGFLTGKDISKFCSYAIIPDLINGKKTVNEIVFEFLKDFGGERNFKVSREKFVHYYLYLNYLIESDDAFEDHIFNQWSITSDEYKAYLFDLSKKESVLIEKASGNNVSPRVDDDPLEPISVAEADKVEYITMATAYKASPPKKASPHSNSFLRSLRQDRRTGGSFAQPIASFSTGAVDNDHQSQPVPFTTMISGESLQQQLQLLPLSLQMHIFGLEERVKMLSREKAELESDYDGLSAALSKVESEMIKNSKSSSNISSFAVEQSIALEVEVAALSAKLKDKEELVAMLTATNQSQDTMIKMMQAKFLPTN